jgi:hypothetical protein
VIFDWVVVTLDRDESGGEFGGVVYFDVYYNGG